MAEWRGEEKRTLVHRDDLRVLEKRGVDRGKERGVSALAIILHRFTPVRDGRTCNEVWDLGVAACARLNPYSFLDVG